MFFFVYAGNLKFQILSLRGPDIFLVADFSRFPKENTPFRNGKSKEEEGILNSFDSGNPRNNGEETVLRVQIVVLSRRRASGNLKSLFRPRTFCEIFDYFWVFNSQTITGLIVNLY